MAGIAGTSFLLLPLIPLGKVTGTRVTNQNKPVIISVQLVDRGVAFLYPSNPKALWYMNHMSPLIPFERGGGSTYIITRMTMAHDRRRS